MQVSVFSTWEKELPKLVFDPRFLVLGSVKERKHVFDLFLRTRAEDERREKKERVNKSKQDFQALLEDADLTPKYVCVCQDIQKFFCLFTVSSSSMMILFSG